MTPPKPIGQLLKELGFITEDQIAVALDVQKVNPKFLGEILVELDFITPNEIAEATAIQNNLDFRYFRSVSSTIGEAAQRFF
jgi:type IV pilus assembly protein PilB